MELLDLYNAHGVSAAAVKQPTVTPSLQLLLDTRQDMRLLPRPAAEITQHTASAKHIVELSSVSSVLSVGGYVMREAVERGRFVVRLDVQSMLGDVDDVVRAGDAGLWPTIVCARFAAAYGVQTTPFAKWPPDDATTHAHRQTELLMLLVITVLRQHGLVPSRHVLDYDMRMVAAHGRVEVNVYVPDALLLPTLYDATTVDVVADRDGDPLPRRTVLRLRNAHDAPTPQRRAAFDWAQLPASAAAVATLTAPVQPQPPPPPQHQHVADTATAVPQPEPAKAKRSTNTASGRKRAPPAAHPTPAEAEHPLAMDAPVVTAAADTPVAAAVAPKRQRKKTQVVVPESADALTAAIDAMNGNATPAPAKPVKKPRPRKPPAVSVANGVAVAASAAMAMPAPVVSYQPSPPAVITAAPAAGAATPDVSAADADWHKVLHSAVDSEEDLSEESDGE